MQVALCLGGEQAAPWIVEAAFVGDAAIGDDPLLVPDGVVGPRSQRRTRVHEREHRHSRGERAEAERGPPKVDQPCDPCQEGQRQEAARHEVAADPHDVEQLQPDAGGEARRVGTAVPDRVPHREADREDGNQQGRRVRARGVDEVEDSLLEQQRGVDARRELRLEGVREGGAVVDERKGEPRQGGCRAGRDRRQQAPGGSAPAQRLHQAQAAGGRQQQHGIHPVEERQRGEQSEPSEPPRSDPTRSTGRKYAFAKSASSR